MELTERKEVNHRLLTNKKKNHTQISNVCCNIAPFFFLLGKLNYIYNKSKKNSIVNNDWCLMTML